MIYLFCVYFVSNFKHCFHIVSISIARNGLDLVSRFAFFSQEWYIPQPLLEMGMVPAMTCFHGFLRQLPWDDMLETDRNSAKAEIFLLVSFKVFPCWYFQESGNMNVFLYPIYMGNVQGMCVFFWTILSKHQEIPGIW